MSLKQIVLNDEGELDSTLLFRLGSYIVAVGLSAWQAIQSGPSMELIWTWLAVATGEGVSFNWRRGQSTLRNGKPKEE